MKKRIKILLLILAVVCLSIFLSIFLVRKASEDKILAEIEKLNPDEATIQALKYAECKTLEKSEKVWIVKDCNGNYYFKLFLQNGGYYLGYCTNWVTPREAVLKLEPFIGKCIDLNAEDKEVTQEGMRRAGLVKYLVCGREIVFKDECVVGG